MRTRYLIIATAAAALMSTGAYAQEATPDTWKDAPSTYSRSQVLADLALARSDGSIDFTRDGYLEHFTSTTSRADIRLATIHARQSGELAAINNEAFVFMEPARVIKADHAGTAVVSIPLK